MDSYMFYLGDNTKKEISKRAKSYRLAVSFEKNYVVVKGDYYNILEFCAVYGY